MNKKTEAAITEICREYDNDGARMMDILRAVQKQLGCVPGWAMERIAGEVGTQRVEVESVVSFYAFLSCGPKGKVVIRLAEDAVNQMNGSGEVAEALADELGIDVGETTADGQISLERAACIGMCDQSPAALVNDVVVTNLTPGAARQMVRALRADPDPAKLVYKRGDGKNADDLIKAMVDNNLRKRGEVIFGELESGQAILKASVMTPAEVVRDVKTARLRGRGGAGFPTGMKWEFARAATGEKRSVICNADEGEPGTFKDRVILTERPELLFEGMAIAGYAIGSETGILYLRGEYAYLRDYLESVLAERRAKGLLGDGIAGKKNFNFDIRIQLGAGAYICGEETALISSAEGLRGDPKTRPPFPAQEGYLGSPTVVNNVETFCCVAQILDKGPGWFMQIGSDTTTGTKVLSVSGDCTRPGVYEVPFGVSLTSLLKEVGGEDAMAVQVGGPSGEMVGPDAFDRKICYDDLATGGSIIVFGSERSVLEAVRSFMEFFVEESCGYCTPCRVGNVLLAERMDRILEGKGTPADLDYLQELGTMVKATSRCGLGQTSPNPVLTTLKNFRPLYEARVQEAEGSLRRSFDLDAALAPAEALAGRTSVLHQGQGQS